MATSWPFVMRASAGRTVWFHVTVLPYGGTFVGLTLKPTSWIPLPGVSMISTFGASPKPSFFTRIVHVKLVP